MKTLRNSTLVMLLLAAVLMAGCKKENSTASNGQSNPNPSQDTPLSENFLAEFESIYQLYPNVDGSFFALAAGEHTDFLLRLSSDGSVMSKKDLGFRSRRCMLNTGEHIFIIGNLDYIDTPYTMYKKGCVAVFDHSLNMVAILFLSEPQYKIDINTIIQDSEDPSLFIVGGAAIDDSYIQYPYLCGVEFSNGNMTKLDNKILSEYAKHRIIGMVEKNLSGQKDLILETVHYSVTYEPYDHSSCNIHIVKPNVFDEEWGWGHYTWDIAVEGPHGDSYTHGNNSIDSDDENIYFFGYCNDEKETVSGDNGGYWISGCMAAINWREGRETWKKVVAFSNKVDEFADGLLLDGNLYACGRHSQVYYLNSTKNWFSNGLVAKFNLSGELVSYKTFGDSEAFGELSHIVKDSNGKLTCAGFSGENLGNGALKYKSWFLKTDLSSNGSSKGTSADTIDEWFEDLDAESTGVLMDGEVRFGGR